MKKNFLVVLSILFVTILLGGCNDNKKKDTFTDDVIKEVENSDYVSSRCEELDLSDVEVKVIDRKVNQDEAKIKCEIMYSDEYVMTKENVICTATEWDNGWQVDSIEMDDMKELKYYPIKFPDKAEVITQEVFFYNSDGGEYVESCVLKTPHVINDIDKEELLVSGAYDITDFVWEVNSKNKDLQLGSVQLEIEFTWKDDSYNCDIICELSFDSSIGYWIINYKEQSGSGILEYDEYRYWNYRLEENSDVLGEVIYDNEDEKGSVYYLNLRPEQDEAWQTLANKYTEETGIDVKVVTTYAREYSYRLQEEMVSDNAPTLFQVSGPHGLAEWQDYCYDLTNEKVTDELTSESYALKADGNIYGIGYVIESYGIIVNKTLLKEAGYEVSDICSFDDLKMVAEDITARSDSLGFAAFTSTGMDASSDWRFKTHLANIPIYFEYKTDGINTTDAIKGTYLDNYRNIFDLYINNSTCDGADLADKTGDDARNEFINEEAVFWQNGTWEYSTLSYHYSDDELAMIPIYIGAGNEAKQGLCTGTENYWCVNRYASKEDIQATLDFMYWCVTSTTGTETMCDEMGFCIPFKQAAVSDNIFERQDVIYTEEGKVPVSWTFTTMPSEAWKNGVGYALTTYAANQTDANWDKVVEAFVDGWEIESYYSQGIGEI